MRCHTGPRWWHFRAGCIVAFPLRPRLALALHVSLCRYSISWTLTWRFERLELLDEGLKASTRLTLSRRARALDAEIRTGWRHGSLHRSIITGFAHPIVSFWTASIKRLTRRV